jgi:hypothetical protein
MRRILRAAATLDRGLLPFGVIALAVAVVTVVTRFSSWWILASWQALAGVYALAAAAGRRL